MGLKHIEASTIGMFIGISWDFIGIQSGEFQFLVAKSSMHQVGFVVQQLG